MKKLIFTLLSMVLTFTQSCATKEEEALDSGVQNELVNKNDLYIDREPTSISTVDGNAFQGCHTHGYAMGTSGLGTWSLPRSLRTPNDPKFKIVPRSPNGFMIYDATGLKKKDSDAGEYFHMNFGLRDGSDGWYYGFKHNIKDSYIND